VRLTGAVIADDQQALVIDRLVELQLRNDKLGEPFGHFLGNDIGVHEGVRGARLVRVTQLNDQLNRVELDQVSVFHFFSLLNHEKHEKHEKYKYLTAQIF
jgi:hypothetical protein